MTFSQSRWSSLGPFLFTILMNDLYSIASNCFYYIYADDVQLYYSLRPDSQSPILEVDLIIADLKQIYDCGLGVMVFY